MTVIHACLLAVSVVLGQAEIESHEIVARREIARAVRDLSSPEFEVRQSATQFLWKAGKAAIPALRQAAANDQPEMRLRAKSILADFQYGVFADTPADVARLIRNYRDADLVTRNRVWGDVVARAPLETLLAIIDTESDPLQKVSLQIKLLGRLENEGQVDLAITYAQEWRTAAETLSNTSGFDKFLIRSLPHLIATEQYEDAEGVLERAVQAGGDEKAERNLAVYLLLRGALASRIENLRARIEESSSADEMRQLAVFLRVKGDMAGAQRAAEQAGDAGAALVKRLLFDSRNWKQLAEMEQKEDPRANRSVQPLGFKAAYSRLAGKREDFGKAIEAIRQVAQHANSQELAYCREAFFLNGFTGDALELLKRDDREQLFKVELMRNEYEAAFQTFGIGTTSEARRAWLREVLASFKDRSVASNRRLKLSCHTAQLLSSLGEREEATEMFKQLAATAQRARDNDYLRVVIEFESKAGMSNLAFEHAAMAQSRDPRVSVVDLLFRSHKATAAIWWDIYVELDPEGTVEDRLGRLRKLFYRGQVDEEVIRLLKQGFVAAGELGGEPAKRSKRINAVAETCLLRDQVALAREYFASIVDESDAAAVHLGDLMAKEEKWQESSGWYAKAFKLGRKPYMLHLSGEMLKRAGKIADGEKAIQIAALMPLATETRHEQLASPLAKRGYAEAAVQNWDLLRRCSTWSEGQMFAAVGALGDAVSAKDPLKAAAYWEQRMLNCLQEAWYFTDQSSYVRIPHLVHRIRAKGLLEQGDASNAIQEVRFCQQIWPGELNVVEECVPLLDARGRQTDADELFEQAYSVVEKNCRMFPNSALHHNNLAWMSARCSRRLDEALFHVQRALEIVPDSAQYIDTLSEVHFQRGDIDKAIENAKRCIELDPETDFYKQQLARFEKAKSA